MTGISASSGIFSGINTSQLISQLLQIEARPRQLIENRIIQLQTRQAAYLDLNSRLGSLRSAASAFRIENTFDARRTTSSNEGVLRATAARGAPEGTFDFLVDRLVTSQQLLSRGFTDRNATALNAGTFTFESERAALQRDLRLTDLNAGQGVERGVFRITQGSTTADIDLSRAVNLSEVIEAINNASGIDITASIDGRGLRLESQTGEFTVSDLNGRTTAADLGILGASASQAIAGSDIYTVGASTALSALNDGNGVFIADTSGTGRFDFRITVGVTAVNINIGDLFNSEGERIAGPVSTLGEVVERINTQLEAAGITAVTARIASSGDRLEIQNTSIIGVTITEAVAPEPGNPNRGTTTAADLGIKTVGFQLGSFTGERIIAGASDTLLRNINGGSGLGGDGTFSITARDGTVINVDASGAATVNELLQAINSAGAGLVIASVNSAGSGIRISDTTGATGDLIIAGETAESLGIATTGTQGDSIESNLQKAYVRRSTRLSDLGIGTGVFVITDGSGNEAPIDIGTDTRTLAQLIDEANAQLNARDVNARLRINDNGDGIIVEERTPGAGAGPIRVSDRSGQVARNLRIAGEADGIGPENFINGTFETTITFGATDTLSQIVDRINDARTGMRATILNDGSSTTPFRISMVAQNSGEKGRVLVDTMGFDLGLRSLERGDDARVFYGSQNPADAVLITNSTNSLDDVIAGVSIDLVGRDPENTTTVSITRNVTEFEEKVNSLLTAFNSLVSRIDFVTRFDAETEQRGTLLNDSTARNLRAALFNAVRSNAINPGGSFSSLLDVGVRFGPGGKLELNTNRFREALEQDFDGVRALFENRELVAPTTTVNLGDGATLNNAPAGAREFSSLGIAGIIEELATRYTDSIDGVLTLRRNALDSQIRLQQRRVETFTARLADRRGVLEAQFLAMERAIGGLQSQQQSLASLQIFRPIQR